MKTPKAPAVVEPADPDAELPPSARRPAPRHAQLPVVAVVACGGMLGAAARYGATLLRPTTGTGFPWTTVLTNVVGCAVIGAFMVLLTEVWTAHRLVRPFFGTGVLGGFTTFSTYTVDVQRLLTGGRAGAGLGYLVLTPAACLVAVGAAAWATRTLVARRGT
ncbi:fluoride efflux transporter FluC [Streptomyces sp. NPDC057579]|uniref:fluoride efflux transporter FluC n=1 Tax=unclassified Streptomyces TaxID=2593676 RepID=UPI0036AFE626